jgi:hypothetical protein
MHQGWVGPLTFASHSLELFAEQLAIAACIAEPLGSGASAGHCQLHLLRRARRRDDVQAQLPALVQSEQWQIPHGCELPGELDAC